LECIADSAAWVFVSLAPANKRAENQFLVCIKVTTFEKLNE
jgi:hypothetical protein